MGSAPAQVRLDAGFLTGSLKQLERALARQRLVRRAGASVDVWITRVDMSERELAIACEHPLGDRDRVAAALVLVNTEDDLPEHRVSSWLSYSTTLRLTVAALIGVCSHPRRGFLREAPPGRGRPLNLDRLLV